MVVPFGFSVGDFITLGQLAFRVYRSYQDAPSSFTEVSEQIKILHINLKEVADRLEEDGRRILPSQRATMQEVASSCQSTLERLDGVISQYSAMDMQRQLTWERLRWQAQDQLQIKQDLTVKLIALSNLNHSLSGSSTKKLLLNLQRLVTQAIATRKQGTIVSALTNADMGEDRLWVSIGRDLQVAGISREMVTANRDVIRQQIEYFFGSGLIATDVSSEDAESSWEGCSITRTASTATSGRAMSNSTTMYQQSFQDDAFHQQGQNSPYLKQPRRLPTPQSQISRFGSRQIDPKGNKLPQCPWQKLSCDQPPLTNDDATYRPYVVEIKLVTPPSKSTAYERDGFSFRRNYVSQHSWVFLRLSQHTRHGIKSLSTPDPYNPVQDHGRQFSQKWTEFAFLQAFRGWGHMLLKTDQPVYVCLPSSQENVLDALVKIHSPAFPIAFSLDLDTDAIVFWKLARRWPGSPAFHYRAKSMDEVPKKGLLQYIKRISLRKQAKTLNHDGTQGQGQMLIMLLTQQAIDQSRAWANTWIIEQEFGGRNFGAFSRLESSYSDSPKSPSILAGSNNPDTPKGGVPYASMSSINLQSDSLPYLAKASAVCAFEASLPNEMSFTSGDEIWITQYVESELWEGINQRTQQKGLFPNTLVKIFLVKRMPSKDKMPFEIGTSAHSFDRSPIENTFLSPSGIGGKDASFPNRAHRSASTGDIQSVASAPSPSTHYELDSTLIDVASKPSSMASERVPSPTQRGQVTRIKSSASDKGPGRTVSQSFGQLPQDWAQDWAPTPFDEAYRSQRAGPDINGSQSQQSWAPTPLGPTMTPAGRSKSTVSPSVIPFESLTGAGFQGIFRVLADIRRETTSESVPVAANNLELRSKLAAFQQELGPVRTPMQIEHARRLRLLRKAQGSEAPPADAGSISITNPQLPTWLVESTDNEPTDQPEDSPSIQPDIRRETTSESVSVAAYNLKKLRSKKLAASQQELRPVRTLMQIEHARRLRLLRKAQESEAPPADAGSISITNPQLPTWLVESTDNEPTDQLEDSPSIQPDIRRETTSESVSVAAYNLKKLRSKKLAASQQELRPVRTLMQIEHARRLRLLRKAQGSEALPADAGSISITNPQLPT